MAKMKKFDMKDRKMKEFGVVPAGTYLSKVEDSEVKENNSKTGDRLNIEWTIQKGEFKGRKFWSGLNIRHENPQAEEIAMDELASIHRALGFKTIQSDTKKLHKRSALVTLEIEPEKKNKKGKVTSKPRNNPTSYESTTSGGKPSSDAPWNDKGKKDKKKKNKKSKK